MIACGDGAGNGLPGRRWDTIHNFTGPRVVMYVVSLPVDRIVKLTEVDEGTTLLHRKDY